jgi:DNA invertase Pin-like site-specific DNA recombinase
MTKCVALYARESFDGNSIVDQIVELTGVVTSRNWSVVKTYVDQTIAYDKNPQSGAGFLSLCEGVSQHVFDIVLVCSIDRIGRSLQEFVAFLLDLEKQGIDFYAHKQKIDTTLPEDKALFRFCSLFSKFEHDIIELCTKVVFEGKESGGVF